MDDERPPQLDDLEFEVADGARVAICGRGRFALVVARCMPGVDDFQRSRGVRRGEVRIRLGEGASPLPK